MRLWHYKLIPALPTKQLVSQWRELWAILGNIKKYGNPHHVLVNKIMDYNSIHLAIYAKNVSEEMKKRGFKLNKTLTDFYDELESLHLGDSEEKIKSFLFGGWHDIRYLRQCYYNLQEKYDCGAISEEEWNKILEQVKVFIDARFMDV